MTAAIMTVGLTLAMNSFGVGYGPSVYHAHTRLHGFPAYILPPGPGAGWGFPNDAPDHYGWVDYGPYLPLGADRTAEYYFPRYHAAPPDQLFFPTYYNAFETRGQRYIPFCQAGGEHPMGGPPLATAELPVSPYAAMPDTGPLIPVPRLNGRVEAPPDRSIGAPLNP
jgi:hypothetical protein